MKKRYIKINDPSQINTSKISVYDLNNRYVDPEGNIYGLKYNRILHKVEVIKIERIHSSEMPQFQKKMMINREHHQQTEYEENSTPANTDEEIDDSFYFEPDMFIEKVFSETETHRERLKGIMMNITDSNIVNRDNKHEATEYDDIMRTLEIEGIQLIEKMESYYRELTNYPRSVTYYQAKIDKDGKHTLDKLSNNSEKTMRFIYYYELSSSIKKVYASLKKNIVKLNSFISKKNIDDIPGINKHQKQSLNDAKISIKNTMSDINSILGNNELLYEYCLNVDNY